MLLLIFILITSVLLLCLTIIKERKSGYATDFENYQDEKVNEFIESEVDDVV